MARKDIVSDTQLLVLLAVGHASRDFIRTHKRLATYSADDFELLVAMLARARRVLVTPHVLAETSNLIRQGNKSATDEMMAALRDLIDRTDECHVPATNVTRDTEFVALGLTDTTLLTLLDKSWTLLTADLELYVAAIRAGRRAENFNHARTGTR